MKKLVLFFLCIVPFVLYSQSVTVYRSFEEYQNKKGLKFEAYQKMVHTPSGKYRLVVRKAGKNMKVKCEKLWGFVLAKELYRTYGTGQYVKLVSEDKLYYFENGEAYLNKGTFIVGHYNFVAKTIDGELVPMPNPDSKPEIIQQYEQFKESNPQYKKFFDCFDKSHNLEICRDCIDRFNYPDKIRPFQ